MAIEAQQRKEQRDLVYAKQEAIDNLINGIIITVIVGVSLFVTGGLIYFVGNQQGKW